MRNPAPPTTKSISDLLQGDSGGLVRRTWPDDQGPGTLSEALVEAGDEELLKSLLRHLSLMDSNLPVVAVVGLVNAGKSSTVGTFLSPAGRQRDPRNGRGRGDSTFRPLVSPIVGT